MSPLSPRKLGPSYAKSGLAWFSFQKTRAPRGPVINISADSLISSRAARVPSGAAVPDSSRKQGFRALRAVG